MTTATLTRRDTCDVCGAAGTRWLVRQGRELVRCAACDYAWVPDGVLRSADGVSIYEDAGRALFTDFADYYDDESVETAARARLAWIRQFACGGRLLDVGANYGHFVRAAAGQFDAAGLEPSPHAVEVARTRLHAPVQVGSLAGAASGREGQVDVVTLFDVIEHLDDPRAALAECRRCLRPGGHLFLTTPDSGSVVARLMGRRWHYLDLEQHVSIFSATALERLLVDAGFTVVSRRTFGRDYRLSYVNRRLRDLGRDSALFRVVHALALPLRLAPTRHVRINLRDVMGIAARAT